MKKKLIALVTVLALTTAGTGVALARQHGGFDNNHNRSGYCDNNNHGGFFHQNGNDNNRDSMNAGRGGFNGPAAKAAVSTVEEAKKMSDDTRVTLRGYITQAFGDEEYLFKDDSGTITVEIDNRRWRGQVVNADDLVEIQGKIDRDLTSVEIDVRYIIKINK